MSLQGRRYPVTTVSGGKQVQGYVEVISRDAFRLHLEFPDGIDPYGDLDLEIDQVQRLIMGTA